jgi:hypothetical protein
VPVKLTWSDGKEKSYASFADLKADFDARFNKFDCDGANKQSAGQKRTGNPDFYLTALGGVLALILTLGIITGNGYCVFLTLGLFLFSFLLWLFY